MALKIFKIPFLVFLTFFVQSSFAKTDLGSADSVSQKYFNWFNKDYKTASVFGMSTDRAYEELLKGKDAETVIVAVIDSGIDINHEDLKSNIWVNKGEIAGNNKDDDQNGYIDDIHGWNFLGNPSGENITFERLAITRAYARLKQQFEGKDKSTFSEKEKAEFESYMAVKQEYERELDEAKETLEVIESFGRSFSLADEWIASYIGNADYTVAELKALVPENEQLMAAKEFLLSVYNNGFTKEEFEAYKTRCENAIKYHLNPDFDPRPLVGDNPNDMDEFLYGNNDVQGPDAGHGTHVAGIIAGVRDNGLGIDGIAAHVKIMALRAVPDGDERDKDIANAIRYAVNNGAQVINMSFGKNTSNNREAVEEAIKLCEEKGVILVHAAGNEAVNVDEEMRFPTKIYKNTGEKAANFINVGASGLTKDKSLVASFSNYGQKNVDIFAPGVDIYSLAPENDYQLNSGTSMASPMVSGLVALLISYYPSFEVDQIKEILYKSATSFNKKVYVPSDEEGEQEKARFKSLSLSGGIINAYEAVKMAEKMTNRE